jgi:hypothetical protein
MQATSFAYNRERRTDPTSKKQKVEPRDMEGTLGSVPSCGSFSLPGPYHILEFIDSEVRNLRLLHRRPLTLYLSAWVDLMRLE